jgi:hypothetical protein
MGGSGISVLGFWPETASRTLVEQIQTHDLDIDDNIIEGNCTHPPEELAPPGPARGRRIRRYRPRQRRRPADPRQPDPQQRRRSPPPRLRHLRPARREHRRREQPDPGQRPPRRGHRPRGPPRRHRPPARRSPLFTFSDHDRALDLSQPAARVRGNTVLQPAGRALQLYGLGPMFVEGNVLVSEGLAGLDSSSASTPSTASRSATSASPPSSPRPAPSRPISPSSPLRPSSSTP